eukprot:TRINITY_DN39126_c0_g1_i1.p1 TRINITY_DN39126_c0_g1~~TRINITY_DN39126_c0_g1_i1.p1  ORF type:complete len:116 (-),score=20.23 TRINITY_DN39126_c0_g1_i1:61-408(-)
MAADGGSVVAKHCEIANCNYGGWAVRNSKLVLESCVVQDHKLFALLGAQKSQVSVDDSTIRRCKHEAMVINSGSTAEVFGTLIEGDMVIKAGCEAFMEGNTCTGTEKIDCKVIKL